MRIGSAGRRVRGTTPGPPAATPELAALRTHVDSQLNEALRKSSDVQLQNVVTALAAVCTELRVLSAELRMANGMEDHHA